MSKLIKLTTPISNNSFSYEQRKAVLGKAEIQITPTKTGLLKDLILGTHIVFEERDHKGHIRQCTGRDHNISIEPETHNKKIKAPIHIFDNHNHALLHRCQFSSEQDPKTKIEIIHIDQHSDLTPLSPQEEMAFKKRQSNNQEKERRQKDYRTLTHNICNVGNFIPVFLKLFPQSNFLRIKSESQLLNHNRHTQKSEKKEKEERKIIILDIDLDFRAPEMCIEQHEETIKKIQEQLKEADHITIASSPFFLEKKLALRLVSEILTD